MKLLILIICICAASCAAPSIDQTDLDKETGTYFVPAGEYTF